MKSIIVLIVCLTVLAGSGCGILSKRFTKSSTEHHKVSTFGKNRIKLENIRGSIALSRSSDSAGVTIKALKEVKVKKKYLNTPFDEISIDIDTTKFGAIEITTNIEKKGEDNIFKFNMDRDQRVDYEIQIPADMEVEIDNTSGNISADRISNDLIIDLVSGDVSLERFTGRLECDITNGDFTGKIDSTRGININTINGNISLHLNNFMNAYVRAETVNGKITQELLNFREVIKESKLFKGKLGTGNPEIDIRLETVNGKIRLFGRNEI